MKYLLSLFLGLSFFAQALPSTHVVLHKAGWCWYQDPRAIIHKGKLIAGGLDGQTGDVRVGIFDLAEAKSEGECILQSPFQRDDHNAPVFYARPDGSVLAMWAKHGQNKIHYYRISDTEDYLKWGVLQEFHHQYELNAGVTYMNLYYLQQDKLLYNFFRDGQTYNPSFIISRDHGLTWSARTHFIQSGLEGRHRPYARYAQVDENTIGISYTDGHPRNYGNSLYYVEWRGGSFYRADGSLIKSLEQGPLLTTEGEKIYVGSETSVKEPPCESVPNSAWTCAIAKDPKGPLSVGYTLYLNNEDHRFRLATWDGKRWHDREIAYAGHCLYTRESSYTGLMCFDPEDTEMVYISTDVNPNTGEELGGVHEIYRARIPLDAERNSIVWEPLTTKSPHRQLRPMVVAQEGYKVLLWLSGPWNTFTDYDVELRAMLLENP